MRFSIQHSLQILERTPAVLESLLSDLPEEWTHINEGADTWSAFDIVGHLIHGEKTDWMVRVRIILSEGDKNFKPFDRFAQLKDSEGKTLANLLEDFKALRKTNLAELKGLNLGEDELNLQGMHPHFGQVTLRQLLATWVVHDLNHIWQISRVMSKQYNEEVGPWTEYLGILKS